MMCRDVCRELADDDMSGERFDEEQIYPGDLGHNVIAATYVVITRCMDSQEYVVDCGFERTLARRNTFSHP